MSAQHLSAEVLGRFVMGLSDASEEDSLANHVRVCPACALALQREAQVELAAVQAVAQRRRARARPSVAGGAWISGFAAAATVVLVLAAARAAFRPVELRPASTSTESRDEAPRMPLITADAWDGRATDIASGP